MREKLSVIIVIMSILLLSSPILFSTNLLNQPVQVLNDLSSSGALPTIVAFSSNHHLSTIDLYYNHHVEPTLAISDNGTLFTGWKNAETHNGAGAQVSFTKSVDGGETWESPTDMVNFEGLETRKSDPWLVWHNGTIYYAYLEFTTNDNSLSQITVARSSDYGVTWSQAAASNGTYFADKETMVISDNGTIFVAYDDVDIEPDGLATVRLTRSNDGGNSFNEISVIGYPDWGHLGPYLTLDNKSNIFVAWTYIMEGGGNLLLDNSTDFGMTFGEDRFINSDGNYSVFTDANGGPSKGTIPVIRFDSHNRLYCLWADIFDPVSGSFDVYLRYSDDFGFTWSTRTRINHVSAGDQWLPDMDIDSEDRLHIVYYSEQFGSYKPYYRVVSFSGEFRNITALSDAIAIAESTTSADFTRPGDYFAIRVDSNGIPHVVWTDGRYDEMDIFYAHGLDYIPTTSVTTSTTPSSTTSDTSTTGTNPTSLVPLSVVGVIGVSIFLIVVIVLIRKRGVS